MLCSTGVCEVLACFLPSAFCFLPTAYCLLPIAFCLLPSAAARGDVSGKSQPGEFPRPENSKIASLTPVSVSEPSCSGKMKLRTGVRPQPVRTGKNWGQASDLAIQLCRHSSTIRATRLSTSLLSRILARPASFRRLIAVRIARSEA